MKGFYLVCKNCGVSFSLDDTRVLLDYYNSKIEVWCTDCDNSDYYGVEE